jgi:hypothetical protein
MARDQRKPLTSRVFCSSVQAPSADPNCADRSVRWTETYQIEHVHIIQIDTERMDYDVLNWFFDDDVQPAMINFENLHLSRRERSASRELLRANGYWWMETSQDTFAIKEFLARP